MKLFKRAKIGLALSSGAARGLAHIGLIKALKEKKIAIDLIAGSSIGALVAACYARKTEISDLEEVVLKTDWRQLAHLVDPSLTLLLKGIIHGRKVEELLRALIGDIEFKDLKIPLAVVTCDVNTGEEVVIKEGSVVEAVRASITIPAIFVPVKIKERFLIDGGIVNPVPVSAVKQLGAAFIIASNTIHKPERRKPFSAIKSEKASLAISSSLKNTALTALNDKIDALVEENQDKLENSQRLINLFKLKAAPKTQRIDPDTPSVFDAIIQAIYTMEYEIARTKIKEADLVVTPNIGRIAAFEFYRGKEAILEGYQAAKETLKMRRVGGKALFKHYTKILMRGGKR